MLSRVLILTPLLVLLWAGAAHACLLAPTPTSADKVAAAQTAFAGEIVEVLPAGEFVVHVERIVKGDVPEFVRLASGSPLSSCSISPAVGRRLALAYTQPGVAVPRVDLTMWVDEAALAAPDWRAVQPSWAAGRTARRSVRVTVDGGVCDIVRFDGITRSPGTVRLRFSRAPDPREPGACIELLAIRCFTVVLDHRLGDRRIVGVGDGPRPTGACPRIAAGDVVRY